MKVITCPKCNNTGLADSGGVYPWGQPILIPCDCKEEELIPCDCKEEELTCDACNGSGCEQVYMGHGNIDVIDCSACGGSGRTS